MLSLTIVLIVTLFQYLQKDLNLYQNLMLTTLDNPVKAYYNTSRFGRKSVISSAVLIWNHLQNKHSSHDFMKLSPKALKNFLIQK